MQSRSGTSGVGEASVNRSVVAGRKRPANDNLEDAERFAKRFNLLNLGLQQKYRNANSNVYIPVPGNAVEHVSQASVRAPYEHGRDDLMQVDDTRNRVYIHDLDEELADLEGAEQNERQRLIFLPDIERHFSKLPRQVLAGNRVNDDRGQELVLYSVPKSLTIKDESQDSVRKAIIEARQRAREKAATEARREVTRTEYAADEEHGGMGETAHGYAAGYEAEDEAEEDVDATDTDAMDLG